MACGMITGKAWFKVPSAIKSRTCRQTSQKKYVSGKDVILHLIGKIGVDGAYTVLWSLQEKVCKFVHGRTVFALQIWQLKQAPKNGIFPVDDVTLEHCKDRCQREPRIFQADADAEYDETIVIDLSALRPTVAFLIYLKIPRPLTKL